jgi:glycosyltransferase involved in cell wall biosynthesis
MKRTLVLLTMNEIAAVRQLWPSLPRQVADEILVVDGNSTDGTAEFFRSHGLKVISQSRPGRGAAIQIGAEHATGDALVYFSLDGNEDQKDIGKVFACLEQGADLAIASRMMRGAFNEEDVSWWRPRKWVNKAFTLLANTLWNRGPYVTDTINGFRGITKKAFQDLHIDADDFSIEYQISIRAMKQKLKIVEFPTREGQRIGGESKVKSFPTGIAFLKRIRREL